MERSIDILSLCCSALRYAFTPLMDDSDDEEIEEFLVSANLGMIIIRGFLEMRSLCGGSWLQVANGFPSCPFSRRNKAEINQE